MVCEKCGYQDVKEKEKHTKKLCRVCHCFSPDNEEDFHKYIKEKLDWKILDTFRKYSAEPLIKSGMSEKAKQGKLMTRAPLGYSVVNGILEINQDSSKVHSLFKTFLEKDYSLNSLSKNYGLSLNGLKKVLTNRTYLGEIKFAGALNKGNHPAIISPEIFYAVQRKLNEKLGNLTKEKTH